MQKLEVGLLALASILTAAGVAVSAVVLVNGKKDRDEIENQNKLLNEAYLKISNSANDFQMDFVDDLDKKKILELKLKISKAQQEIENVKNAAKLMEDLKKVIQCMGDAKKNTVFKLNASDYPFLFDKSGDYFHGVSDVERLFSACEDVAKDSGRGRTTAEITVGDLWNRLTGDRLWCRFARVPRGGIGSLCLAMQEEINIRTEDAKKALDDAYSEYTKFREKIKKAKETEKKKD